LSNRGVVGDPGPKSEKLHTNEGYFRAWMGFSTEEELDDMTSVLEDDTEDSLDNEEFDKPDWEE
jgi:hypothetical protein